jgi:hypothetical protein
MGTDGKINLKIRMGYDFGVSFIAIIITIGFEFPMKSDTKLGVCST